MNMPLVPGPGFPLSAGQWEQFATLTGSLSADQALWASGYFAGVSHALRGGVAELQPQVPAPPPGQAAAPVPATRSLAILYGTETGNSAELARRIAEQARLQGLTARSEDMAAYKVRGLKDEQDILIVTSTHGEGDPPEPAAEFFEFLLGRKAPKLDGIRFAVLALGDSTYEKYCEAGRILDRRLVELGATRFAERLDCDVDYDDPATAWVESALATLAADLLNGAGAVAQQPAGFAAPAAASPAPAYDKRRPFPAPVMENIVITGRGSSKETRHIELSLEGSGLTYQPGDALGIAPRNDPQLVDRLLAAAGLESSQAIEVKSQTLPLAEALAGHLEITALAPRFVEHWARLSGARDLATLLAADRREDLTAFMARNHVVDLVETWPVPGLPAGEFAAGLRGLQPRLYSIASSASLAEDEVHVTVSTVRYDLNGTPRGGVCSGHLATLTGDDATVPVYIQENAHFRLPAEDDRPIIMIGAGTGVAPYRAFLQEREARGVAGPAWLFFGERRFRTDFLYQVEWQEHLQEGRLSRLDLAFSRDQAEKRYVHHRMREQAADLFGWIEDGAHLYVCGDAAGLAPDVHRALLDIIATEGRLGPERAEDYLRNLQRDGRYQRDVY